ncbi:MAG TPA: LytTR family DNA-binding domain-containing protein [Blastocatellia bacterium]|nr:LytTR family DNA-binding domain-containing protein [Blastocatellia bacterium]HMV85563.1 LytTR family DNA-binding domain-containing protein [Blastocatellia bacterium]HMX25863.1 LytTR family DNA-binding domain-containing protein [Blastocatellia bacterium]HMY74389.1 LytTR family DNA-binding domain-containing protein [Blastocatellia bacterium]HMZ18500.1 LytTR family DNA-binding domain-containing protein [Blastocatellia bacterium]
MTSWRAIIVDDERLARRELRSLLAEHPCIEIAGEAESVNQALEVARAIEPDVIFLDIKMPGQMPGASGFDLVEQLDVTCRVIFVTAYDAYALRAFEVNALDYLLKPINPDRLAAALARLTANEPAPAQAARKLDYTDRLFLEIGERAQFLKLDRIVCLRAAGDYSELVTTDGKTSLVLKSLKEWEERLPEKHFARIHRSTIVNLEYVERIEGWFNRAYQIYLRQLPEPLPVSRRYAAQLKQKFG